MWIAWVLRQPLTQHKGTGLVCANGAKPGVEAHACISATESGGDEGTLWVWGQTRIHGKPENQKTETKIKIKKLLFVTYSKKSLKKKLYVLIEKHSKLFREESSSQVNRCSFNSPERFCASEVIISKHWDKHGGWPFLLERFLLSSTCKLQPQRCLPVAKMYCPSFDTLIVVHTVGISKSWISSILLRTSTQREGKKLVQHGHQGRREHSREAQLPQTAVYNSKVPRPENDPITAHPASS